MLDLGINAVGRLVDAVVGRDTHRLAVSAEGEDLDGRPLGHLVTQEVLHLLRLDFHLESDHIVVTTREVDAALHAAQ